MTKILISSSPTNLEAALAAFPSTGTVEAEFGDVLVRGSAVTLAHHGSRSGNPAPCLRANAVAYLDAIGLSHFDLDAVGGTLALMGLKPEAPSFWELAAFIDINGAHKLGAAGADQVDIDRLYAWWAWSERNRVFAPRDGSVADVTEQVLTARAVLESILTGDEDGNESALIADGRKLLADTEALNKSSFVELHEGSVVVRASDRFCNHLYVDPIDGNVAAACVAFNTAQGSITVSLAEPNADVSCRKLVQALWGQEAGGHDGIAGSPRGKRMSLLALEHAVRAIYRGLKPAGTVFLDDAPAADVRFEYIEHIDDDFELEVVDGRLHVTSFSAFGDEHLTVLQPGEQRMISGKLVRWETR